LGAQIIDSALSGVPHFEQLELRFSDIGTPLRKTPGCVSSYPVIHLQYTNRRPYVSSPGDGSMGWMFGEHWVISVFPVPRARKPFVRQLLLGEGFPRLNLWLSQPRPPIWYEGCKRIEILFNEDEEVLSFKEHESL
jgi:hypothetical protein